MKFTVDDPRVLMSHILLHNEDLAMAVAHSDGWKAEQLIEPKIFFNGVEVSGEVFEGALLELYKQVETMIERKYADVASEVQRQLEHRMKIEAADILEKMDQLRDVLEDAGSIIKPYWDRTV